MNICVMLVLGVANPTGEAQNYNGLYFKHDELQQIADSKSFNGVPVKAEHRGNTLGTVVSSFLDTNGCLNCVLDIDESSVEGALAAGLVRDGIASELSLGYCVDVQHSEEGHKLEAGMKKIVEVSLVRKGARDACYVLAFEDASGGTKYTRTLNAWKFFDMS